MGVALTDSLVSYLAADTARWASFARTLAGYLAGGASLSALPEAVAWSVAACRAAGTRMPAVTPRDRAAVVVHPTVDRDRPLGR